METSGKTEHLNTTNFVNSGETSNTTPNHQLSLDSVLEDLNTDAIHPDITQFLEKPKIIASGQISTSTTAIGSVALPSFAFAMDMYAKKLEGILGWRGDITVTLQINATKFQQGRIILYWNPFRAEGGPIAAARVRHLVNISQLPHAELDLATMTECSLTIPWVNHCSFYNIPRKHGDFGDFGTYMYSPLISPGGDATADYTLWVSFTNSHVFGASGPQSYYDPAGEGIEAPSETIIFEAQMGKTNIVDKEKREAESRPISYSLAKISSFAGDLGKVPMLSSIFGTVSWAAGVASGIAAYWGFSSVLLEGPADRVVPMAFHGMANADCPTTGVSLGIIQGNQLGHYKYASTTDQDELSLDFIKKVYSYFNVYDWTTTRDSSSSIISLNITPRTFYRDYTTSDGAQLALHSPVSYLSTKFNLWRGGLKFRLKFVKTEFHSGRLAITFTPDNISANPNRLGSNDLAYVNREIIDIRDGNEFEFEIPFYSHLGYCETNTAAINEGSYSTGRLDIRVQNKLRGPSTVSQTIRILLEVAGADDLEFAFPGSSGESIYFDAQMGSADVASIILSSKNIEIGAMKPVSDNNVMSTMCIGEKVTSLRQLLKRNDLMFSSTAALTGVSIYPFAAETVATRKTVDIGQICNPQNPTSAFNTILPLYAMWRGSVRLKIMATDDLGNDFDLAAVLSHRRVSYVLDTLTNWPSTGCFGMQVASTTVNSTLDVQVPYYCKTPASPVLTYAMGKDVGVSYSPINGNFSWSENSHYLPNVAVEVTARGGGLARYTIFRSVGEDFNCGCFCGIPAMLSTGDPAGLPFGAERFPDNVRLPKLE